MVVVHDSIGGPRRRRRRTRRRGMIRRRSSTRPIRRRAGIRCGCI